MGFPKKFHFLLLLLFFLASVFFCQSETDDLALEPLVTLIYQNEDLFMVLNEITLQTGVNIIIDDSVTGFVTIDVMDVPVEKALDILLKPNNIFYKKMDGFYFVCLADPRARGFMRISETAYVQLQHISTAQAQNLIPEYYQKFLRYDTTSRTMTITAPEEIIGDFSRIVEAIDRQSGQLRISVVAVEINKEFLKKKSPFEFSLTIPEEFSGWGSGETTIAWGYGDDPFTLNTSLFDELILTSFQMLERNNYARIHTDPNVLVADGQTASLFIGETRRVLVEDAQGNTVTQSFDVGVRLEVTPNIYPGYVELQLTPQLSHLGSKDESGYVIFSNEVKTTIRVKDGQTAVLSGITVKSDKENLGWVPGLGKIPVLRFFFSEEERQAAEREMIVFVTPRLQRGEVIP
ncbi:MAG TPA: hypothetical protein P5560_06495 [Thermotogota bacterium]|nr:hypothetical protein [Thermotogota bacterium]HRW92578.1 hypothetical protein [Thermotogota bacterium]